jgi:regulator of protease activity HflC (stomatin/prohibitin superfamily)
MLADYLPFVAVVKEFERVAVFRLGRIVGYRGPGVVWRIPFIEEFQRVDSRVVTVDVQPQECMTRDNVPVRVNAVVYFRVEHPDKALVEVTNYRHATLEIAQSTLRSVIGQRTFDQLLGEIEETAHALQEIIDEATDAWGVKVTRTEIKDIQIPDELKRAMAKEAEAERERRAMIIRASGEKEAARELMEAAEILGSSQYGFQMRYLQTLASIAEEGNTVIFAPSDAMSEAAAAASRAPKAKTGE